jgi:hypothetical protein
LNNIQTGERKVFLFIPRCLGLQFKVVNIELMPKLRSIKIQLAMHGG